MTKRQALAERLRRVEVELQRAYVGLDGRAESRMPLARAKTEYRATESAAIDALGVLPWVLPSAQDDAGGRQMRRTG
jgi:hypothetical protein